MNPYIEDRPVLAIGGGKGLALNITTPAAAGVLMVFAGWHRAGTSAGEMVFKLDGVASTINSGSTGDIGTELTVRGLSCQFLNPTPGQHRLSMTPTAYSVIPRGWLLAVFVRGAGEGTMSFETGSFPATTPSVPAGSILVAAHWAPPGVDIGDGTLRPILRIPNMGHQLGGLLLSEQLGTGEEVILGVGAAGQKTPLSIYIIAPAA